MDTTSNLILRGYNWKVGNMKTIVVGKDYWVNGDIPVFSSNVTLMQAKDWKIHRFILPFAEVGTMRGLDPILISPMLEQ